MWRVYSETLSERVPEFREEIRRDRELSALQQALKKSLEYSRTRPLRRLAAATLSNLAIILDCFGLQNAGSQLYSRALYPSGTVGRSKSY